MQTEPPIVLFSSLQIIGRYIIPHAGLLAYALENKNSFQITIFEATKYPTKAQMHIRDTISLEDLFSAKGMMKTKNRGKRRKSEADVEVLSVNATD